MRQRIVRSQHSQRQSRCNGGLKLFRIAERANQAMMRFDMPGVRGNGLVKGLRRFREIARAKQLDTALGKLVGVRSCCGNLRIGRRCHILIVTRRGCSDAISPTP